MGEASRKKERVSVSCNLARESVRAMRVLGGKYYTTGKQVSVLTGF